MLPRIKGALVSLQWALLMHGFDPDDPEATESIDDMMAGNTPS